MSAALVTPKQLRDRLLRAIDAQRNIHNMAAVLEVISSLEKYPITREALEETRLGKLINEVRKRTRDEDLAKRAKKLLRNWQKLIEPAQNEVALREFSGTPVSANGDSLSPPSLSSGSDVTSSGLGTAAHLHNAHAPKPETASHRKRKAERQEGWHAPTSTSKISTNEKDRAEVSTNGTAESLERRPPLHRASVDCLHNEKPSRIPVSTVRPHSSSPTLHTKQASTSPSLRKPVLLQQQQQQQRQVNIDVAASGRGQQPPKSSSNPRGMTQDVLAKGKTLPSTKVTHPVPVHSPRCLESTGLLPASVPLSSATQTSHTDGLRNSQASFQREGHAYTDPSHQHNDRVLESKQDSQQNSRPAPLPPRPGLLGEVENVDGDLKSVERKRRKYRSRDYGVNLAGQPTEDVSKPVRLKDRKLTFDPLTRQIKPLAQKESNQREEEPAVTLNHRTDPPVKQNTPAPVASPFQQTNWKELSRNEIVQSYLNLQNNVLSSSGTHTPGAHFFMTEFLKHEDHHGEESRATHSLVPDPPVLDLPGVTREVTAQDLHRIHTDRWPGVNGCYDTRDNWYDWTQCICLDPHGDESRLNILPYVCLD
ncbi:mediator of RNA polymerase II transcription subunit 26-like [Chanos chanos]|uniref:Mediator of RNA polymerase II transcription subunit 26 n=1 Tax=Chanos chanos TaxID=29144 RepID=A0A6J2W9Q7_CHACN|nr:mediator of RNA polymerase II transcription subunit 26 [Chanos chanos]